MDTQSLQEVQGLMEISYIKAGALYRSYQFIRTCVIDSHLAAFHTAYILFPNVKDLFNSDGFFKDLMALLNDEKYAEAKNCCADQLKDYTFDHTYKEIDFYGSVYDHCFLYEKLICAELDSNQNIPNDSPIHKDVLCKFNTFGYIKALGDPDEPTLILGYSLTTEPSLWVTDKKNRLFKLQFLLLGKEDHMTMCFDCFPNGWYLYDNDLNKPSFQMFDFESLKNYVICMAGYINITQAMGSKLGIADTGGAEERQQEYSSYLQQLVSDVEMEDLDYYPGVIPKADKGTRPLCEY